MNYKLNRRILLFTILAIIIVVIGFLHFTPSARKAKHNLINIKNVEVGMKKSEVYRIMGAPDIIQTSFINNIDTMYYYKTPISASSGIYIQFEESTKRVNQIIK